MQQAAHESLEGTPVGGSFATAQASVGRYGYVYVSIALGLEILLIEGLLISAGCGQPT